MICRLKGSRCFVSTNIKDVLSFVKQATTESGRLTESFEIIQSGFLGLAEDGNKDSFPWIFSTGDIDRCDERVDQGGWELERYLKNPVVLWAHCHSIPAIGIVSDMSANESLIGRIRFNPKEYDEFGWAIGERVKAGVLRAASVGMLVKEIEWIDHRKNPDEPCDFIIRKQELLELSICNVPANPFALQTNEMQSVLRVEDGSQPTDTHNANTGTSAPTARSPGGGHWPLLAM